MALNDRMKNRFRSVIRVIMIVLAVLLLTFGLGIPVANNALAMDVVRDMKALPVLSDTQVVDSVSLAGRLTGPYGSVQYAGALLLKSDRSLDELKEHYTQIGNDREQRYSVCRMQDRILTIREGVTMTFREPIEGEGYYAVYYIRTGGHAMQWWLDMDTRG